MRRALVDLERRVLHEFGLERGRVGVGHDLIIIPRQDQGRHVEFLQVLGLIRFGKRLDAEVCSGEAAIIPCSQNDSRTPSETFAPGRL